MTASAVILRDGDGPSVRIEQHPVAIEAQAQLRLEWSYCPESVYLTRHQVRNEDMPVVIRAVPAGIQSDCPCRFRVFLAVEQQQLHYLSILRVNAEINAAGLKGRTQGRTHARCYPGITHSLLTTSIAIRIRQTIRSN